MLLSLMMGATPENINVSIFDSSNFIETHICLACTKESPQ